MFAAYLVSYREKRQFRVNLSSPAFSAAKSGNSQLQGELQRKKCYPAFPNVISSFSSPCKGHLCSFCSLMYFVLEYLYIFILI